MSTKFFKFEVITPEGTIFSDVVEQAVIPGSEGEFGVLDLHSPVVTSLKKGVIKIFKDGKIERTLKVDSGIVEVNSKNCTVITESTKIS